MFFCISIQDGINVCPFLDIVIYVIEGALIVDEGKSK